MLWIPDSPTGFVKLQVAADHFTSFSLYLAPRQRAQMCDPVIELLFETQELIHPLALQHANIEKLIIGVI